MTISANSCSTSLLKLGVIGSWALVSACASSASDKTAGSDWRNGADQASHVYVQSSRNAGLGLEESVKQMFARLTGEKPRRVSFVETTVARVEIGQTGDPKAAAHEADAAAPPSASKMLNDLVAQPSQGDIRLDAQNRLIDDGWRQIENGYFHSPSGFFCPHTLTMVVNNGDDGTTITLNVPIVAIRKFNDFGTDAACDYVNQVEGVYLTFFASNWPDMSLADHFSAALKHITDRFNIVSEAPLISPTITLADSDHESTIEGGTLTGAFFLEPQDGVAMKTALWLNKTGDWHVKARATYVVARDGKDTQWLAAELMAAVFHAVMLNGVDKYINADPDVTVSY